MMNRSKLKPLLTSNWTCQSSHINSFHMTVKCLKVLGPIDFHDMHRKKLSKIYICNNYNLEIIQVWINMRTSKLWQFIVGWTKHFISEIWRCEMQDVYFHLSFDTLRQWEGICSWFWVVESIQAILRCQIIREVCVTCFSIGGLFLGSKRRISALLYGVHLCLDL